MLGNRSSERIIKAILSKHTYVAFAAMLKNYVNPIDGFLRYTFGFGSYPVEMKVRTPLGVVKPTLFSSHDILTVNEIFCRGDYQADLDVSVVVDIGANIGLSALYFLSRNQQAKVYLYEPNPNNVEKLNINLADYTHRYSLVEKAVSKHTGQFSFGLESSGRYGGLGKEIGSKASYEQPSIDKQITVECLSINDVLAKVLDSHGRIDILKVDTEGSELDIVMSIEEKYRLKISTIYVESQEKPDLPGFRAEKFKTVYRLRPVES